MNDQVLKHYCYFLCVRSDHMFGNKLSLRCRDWVSLNKRRVFYGLNGPPSTDQTLCGYMWKGFPKALRPSHWKQADLGFPKTNFGIWAFELCEKADATPTFVRLNLVTFRATLSVLLYEAGFWLSELSPFKPIKIISFEILWSIGFNSSGGQSD